MCGEVGKMQASQVMVGREGQAGGKDGGDGEAKCQEEEGRKMVSEL